MKFEHVISFTGTPQDIAADQILLSTALAAAVGTHDNVSIKFADDCPLDIFWDRGLVNVEAGTSFTILTQSEALHQAAKLYQSALDSGIVIG